MGRFIINGGIPLRGEVAVSGAKNSALPLLAACLLTEEEVVLHNCPRIGDVFSMQGILEKLGAHVRFSGNAICVAAKEIETVAMPEKLSKKIRSSIFLLGSMLGRMRRAVFQYPGGCEIGARPIDQHLDALRKLGVEIEEEMDTIHCRTEALRGAHIRLSYPSVGATENAILAAMLAEGTTTIENAAREPEIVDLQNLLLAMGGKIRGAGNSRIVIEGVSRLHGAEHTCIPDRIEAGTFLAAAAVTRGELRLLSVNPGDIRGTIDVLRGAGARIREEEDSLWIRVGGRLEPFHLTTNPYPDFPTDMQAQMCVVAALCIGVSRITETVFENRMRHIDELKKAGAEAEVKGHSAYISGVYSLHPADFTATDLRGGAALVLAALAAQGQSTVSRIEYIDRGYEALEYKLSSLGADIRREC